MKIKMIIKEIWNGARTARRCHKFRRDVISLGFLTDKPTGRRGMARAQRYDALGDPLSRFVRPSATSAAGLSQSVGGQDILLG